MEPIDRDKRVVAEVQPAFEYKTLQQIETQVMEDGQPIQQELRERSLELIEQGWEPIEENQDYRRYRRSRARDG